MNVQELINHLQQFNPNTQVMFSHNDHTDFLYKTNMSVNDVYIGTVLSDDECDEDLFNDMNDYIGPEVVLFEFNLE
jgi:hypothetical protein